VIDTAYEARVSRCIWGGQQPPRLPENGPGDGPRRWEGSLRAYWFLKQKDTDDAAPTTTVIGAEIAPNTLFKGENDIRRGHLRLVTVSIPSACRPEDRTV
jgi:hypothetical protein